MVGISCVFDFIDGFAARMLKVHSEIGKQLDSLADMVSFGVVPGVMMYYFLRASMVMSMGNPSDANTFSSNAILVFPYFGFLITIFSAIRLAKFNIDTRQSDSFIGVPTPANTIFIAFLPIALDKVKGDLLHFVLNPFFLVGIVVISSFLLVAPLPLFALKFKNFSWVANKIRFIFLALSLLLLIVFQFVGIPLIIILYIVLSIINNLVIKKSV